MISHLNVILLIADNNSQQNVNIFNKWLLGLLMFHDKRMDNKMRLLNNGIYGIC